MRNIVLSATQMACSWDKDDNIYRAELLVRKAASDGARISYSRNFLKHLIFVLNRIQSISHSHGQDKTTT